MNGDDKSMFRPAYPQCPPGTFIYYIQPGDTLYKLASRYNTTVGAIANANPGLDTHWLRVAQGICIPRRTTFPACPFGTFYVVKPGDTLNKIAKRNNITLQALLQVNPGIDPDLIYVEQVVCIPKAPAGRPPRKKIVVNVEGMTEYRDASLKRSDQGYSIYVLDNFTFTSEEPGIDQIFFNYDPRYFVRIQKLPEDSNLNTLRENALEELRLVGTPDELEGTEIYEPFFRKAVFFLRASSPTFSKDIILMQIGGSLFRFSLNIPVGEASEGVVPSILAMLKTVDVP
ncbi:MAG TPA: LysM peptidoglycan-binding domain-containing protein [Clostridia bacterium]|nr:LysM peptidoglycan-binding domain-containing protein [Clostridia bacterium]